MCENYNKKKKYNLYWNVQKSIGVDFSPVINYTALPNKQLIGDLAELYIKK